MHPGDKKVMFCLATLCMKDGRLNEAKKVLSEVLASGSDYTDAVNLLEEVEHQLDQRKNKNPQ
jgi:cytochrome c-type biogenesis protein CcmH/NrfG